MLIIVLFVLFCYWTRHSCNDLERRQIRWIRSSMKCRGRPARNGFRIAIFWTWIAVEPTHRPSDRLDCLPGTTTSCVRRQREKKRPNANVIRLALCGRPSQVTGPHVARLLLLAMTWLLAAGKNRTTTAARRNRYGKMFTTLSARQYAIRAKIIVF